MQPTPGAMAMRAPSALPLDSLLVLPRLARSGKQRMFQLGGRNPKLARSACPAAEST